MTSNHISDHIRYIGVDDHDIDLFESQYLVPDGITYNSYVIIDEAIAIVDTVDERKIDEWFAKLQAELNGRTPAYLIVNHVEPDHTGGIERLARTYPTMRIVGNAKTIPMIGQFKNIADLEMRAHIVAEGDSLSLGTHTLHFVMAPMVHWPEAMVSYESHTQTLFSADGFGKFGTDPNDSWACEARRYYYNIVGKYGRNVQMLLKKLAGTPVSTIAPLHGSVLRENIAYYIDMYDKWSTYQAEEDSILICYASIHGNTAHAAHELQRTLAAKGKTNVEMLDLSRDDMAQAVEDAFVSETLVLAASSYDADVFPPMAYYLSRLKAKQYQNRRVGIIENGSWAPTAAKIIRTALSEMKNIEVLEPVVSIRSTLKPSDMPALEALADALIGAAQ